MSLSFSKSAAVFISSHRHPNAASLMVLTWPSAGSTRMNLRHFNHSWTKNYKLKKCKLKEFVSSILKPRESQSAALVLSHSGRL